MAHDVWCSRPSPQPDREGILKCPSCRYLADVAPPPRKTPLSNYRCRTHPEQAVTWKGTGCASCSAQKTKRKATAPRDDTRERQFLT